MHTLVEVSLGILNTDIRRQLGWIHVEKVLPQENSIASEFYGQLVLSSILL